MAILKAFSILDSKAAAYGRPMFFPTDAMAVRSLADAVADEKSDLARHAPDFSMYCVGSFDEASGQLTSLSAPVYVAKCLDFVPASYVAPPAAPVNGAAPAAPGRPGILDRVFGGR